VYGNAQVSGDAQVYGNAQVSGNAWVYGNAQVYGDARVYGNAWVYGNAQVSGDAQVYGDARVSGNAWVYGNACVYGDAQVYGDAHIDCATAILWITLGAFYTATITRKHLFIGCKKFTREEVKYMKKQDAINHGLPKEFANKYRKLILAAMKLVSEKEASDE